MATGRNDETLGNFLYFFLFLSFYFNFIRLLYQKIRLLVPPLLYLSLRFWLAYIF
jgi:hypothetical protein